MAIESHLLVPILLLLRQVVLLRPSYEVLLELGEDRLKLLESSSLSHLVNAVLNVQLIRYVLGYVLGYVSGLEVQGRK